MHQHQISRETQVMMPCESTEAPAATRSERLVYHKDSIGQRLEFNRTDISPSKTGVPMTLENKGQWRIDRKFNVANLLVISGVIVGVFIWGSDLQQQVKLNGNNIHHLETTQQRDWNMAKDDRDAIKAQLAIINAKLDRLLARNPHDDR